MLAIRARTGVILSSAALLNFVLLMLPVWIVGQGLRLGQQWPAAGLIVMAELLLLVEAGSMHYAADQVPARSDHRNTLAHALALATGIMLLMILWSGLLSQHPVAATRVCFGMALMAGGVVLRGVAIHQLRERFVTSIQTDCPQPLLQEGIYAWVRHPSETGLLAFSLGAVLCGGSLVAVALWTIGLVPLMITRLSLEDGCLQARHGHHFREYRRKVGGLMPTPWR